MKKYFQVFLSLENKKAAVIGPSTATKNIVNELTECGAQVKVIENGRYKREMILDSDIVFACDADPAVNEDIYAACGCMGIPVYIPSRPEKCSFFLYPAGEKDPMGDVGSQVSVSGEKGNQNTDDLSAGPAAGSDVEMYTDGAARGNPNGPGGYGVVIIYTGADGKKHKKELSKGYAKTTNNRMELMAAIVGLESLTEPCNVTLHSDSQYLVKAFNDNWISGWVKNGWKNSQKQPVKNIDLWKRLLKAKEMHNVRFVWVKGHDGDEYNERCDYLATSAADAVGRTGGF